MVFSSFTFLLVFLPLVIISTAIAPPVLRNGVLLLFSFVFYAWGEPAYSLLMLGSIAVNYLSALFIDKYRNSKKIAKAIIIVNVILNLSALGFFKYYNFFMENISAVTGISIGILTVTLPIGISFYTFQAMSYTLDVYRNVVSADKNPVNFACYVTLFPQLIAGPIVQYKTVAGELRVRSITLEKISEGVWRFCIGLGKKVLFANQIGAIWETISAYNPSEISGATAWIGAIAFTFQIYFDFSGYSDMAIGLGKMFGFTFLENFNLPYISKSISELSQSLIKGLTSERAKATALYNYVRDYISYEFYYDTQKGAEGTLASGSGNCCDQAQLLVAMGRSVGMTVRFDTGYCTFSSGSTYGHVWTQFLIDGSWINADPTSTRNSFGVIVNWDTSSYTDRGTYDVLPY